jgi:mono/diheme cytochrome c family protein
MTATRTPFFVTALVVNVVTVAAIAAGCGEAADAKGAAEAPSAQRGEYLVTAAGCNDCHTPLKMGPNGPERDYSRRLSGHPADLVMPEPPPTTEAWNVNVGATMTAWHGPWGTTYTANLTPDDETGLGTWDQQTFIDTIRNGRHMGKGRPIMPPMPIDMIRTYTDEDLASIYLYLQSIPAVNNPVPENVLAPPPAAP